jgi:hypothetical protein
MIILGLHDLLVHNVGISARHCDAGCSETLGIGPRNGLFYQDAEKFVFDQAAQKGPDARRRHPSDGYPVPIHRMGAGARRT